MSVIVKCKDGKYYRGLVYRAKDNSWFLCFDEKDPPEFVMKERRITVHNSPYQHIRGLGLYFCGITRGHDGLRSFPKAISAGKTARLVLRYTTESAKAFFLKLEEPRVPMLIPRPWDTYEEVYEERPKARDGNVYYGI